MTPLCEQKLKKALAERDSFENAWKDQAKDSIFYIQVNRNLQAANKRLAEKLEKAQLWPNWIKACVIVAGISTLIVVLCTFLIVHAGRNGGLLQQACAKAHLDDPIYQLYAPTITREEAIRNDARGPLDQCQSEWRSQRREIMQKNETIRLQNERLKRYREIRGEQ